MKNRIGLGLAISLLLAASIFGATGCKPSTGTGVYVPQTDKEYILIFNCVDELLTGNLEDAVKPSDLAPQYEGQNIIGLGTTLRPHSGELLFISGNCYWADPTNQGRITEVSWKSSEWLPFCAITKVSDKYALIFTGVTDDIHGWLVNKLLELDIPLAAIKVSGRFSNVDLSIADILPSNPSESLKSTLVTVSEEGEWQMAGFYASRSDDQAVISVPESPVHVHGKTVDSSYGGHIKKANSVSATVTIYPIKQFILSNRVPTGVPAVSGTK